MSVIRQPGVLGRTTRRRVVGMTAALSAAGIETIAVGLWFALVVGDRTTSAALAGLGILFCGSLLRAGIFGATVSELDDLLQPRRLGAALVLTASWIVWLLAAESVGGVVGIVAATAALAILFVGQFSFERRVFRFRSSYQYSFAPVAPGLLLALGASILLVSAWFVDVTLVSPVFSLEVTTFVIQIEALQLGILAFGLFAFLAHQHRFQLILDS